MPADDDERLEELGAILERLDDELVNATELLLRLDELGVTLERLEELGSMLERLDELSAILELERLDEVAGVELVLPPICTSIQPWKRS